MRDDPVMKLVRLVIGGVFALMIVILIPQGFTAMLSTFESGNEPAAPPEASPAPSEPTDWSWLGYVGIVVGVVIAVLVAIVLVTIAAGVVVDRRRRSRAAAQESRAAQVERWGKGTEAFTKVSLAVTEFETDPETIFIRPLLLDTNESDTAAFFTAFHEAGKLHLENIPRDEQLITGFVDAAMAAEKAFGRADHNARTKAEVGITHNNRQLTQVEQRSVLRARGLLRIALDPTTDVAHARNAYRKVAELLAGIVTVPRAFENRLTRSIDGVHRREITSGSSILEA